MCISFPAINFNCDCRGFSLCPSRSKPTVKFDPETNALTNEGDLEDADSDKVQAYIQDHFGLDLRQLQTLAPLLKKGRRGKKVVTKDHFTQAEGAMKGIVGAVSAKVAELAMQEMGLIEKEDEPRGSEDTLEEIVKAAIADSGVDSARAEPFRGRQLKRDFSDTADDSRLVIDRKTGTIRLAESSEKSNQKRVKAGDLRDYLLNQFGVDMRAVKRAGEFAGKVKECTACDDFEGVEGYAKQVAASIAQKVAAKTVAKIRADKAEEENAEGLDAIIQKAVTNALALKDRNMRQRSASPQGGTMRKRFSRAHAVERRVSTGSGDSSTSWKTASEGSPSAESITVPGFPNSSGWKTTYI